MNWQQVLALVCFGAAGGILFTTLTYIPITNGYVKIIRDLLDEIDRLTKE